MKKTLLKAGCLTFLLAASGLLNHRVQGQTNNLPGSFAVPAASVDTSKKGFLVRTWQSPGQPASLLWTEEQLAGLHGDNTADTSLFTDNVFGNGYLDETGVINYWDSGDEGNFPNNATQNVPGLASADSYAIEVFALLDLPAGTLTMGVNSDDGFRVTALHAPDPRDKLLLNAAEYDAGRGASDSLFTLVVEKAGIYPFRLIFFEGGSGSALEWFTVSDDGKKHLINNNNEDAASIKAYRGVTGGARAYASRAFPLPGDKAAAPDVRVSVDLVDGASPIDAATAKLSVDGTPVASTATKAGNVTTVNFSAPTLSPSGATHSITLDYSEGANAVSTTWSYTVGPVTELPATAKVTPETSKPGFTWSIFANSATTSDVSNLRVENALSGALKDADGNPLPNLANPAAQGVASGAASAPNPANAPISFEIPTVINLSQETTDLGNFPSDGQMPGVPATDQSNDGLSAEIITYIELPAGATTMGINSDDGFRTTAGNPVDTFEGVVLGQFDGGRASRDTLFHVVAKEAGVYGFRTIYSEGGGDASIEWFMVKPDGSKVLVNDTAKGGLKAYAARTGGTDPAIKAVSPSTLQRQVNQPYSSVSVVVADGSSKTIDDNSIVLQLDGKTVTTTKNRQGKTVTITYTPTDLQVPDEKHTASLTFKDSTGAFTRKQDWTFYNLKNLVLPAAKITENFDSTAEDALPTGWVATNFSSHCADGRDITSQASESYEDWVVVSTANMTSLDGGSANVAPGQTFNGQPVTEIASGNVLYAESDGRCNTDSAGGPNKGQAQFIVTKAFDCSQIENVVLTFSSLYTQNQDSIGAVEYSVDGGATWLPVVYYLDPVDIVLKADGTVDAVATLTASNADTASWVVDGVAKGGRYGDGIAAPITQDLAIYIAPRINDNQTEGARIEACRLTHAGKKSDVRLRFAQLGTDSWWFAVDNIAFYDVAPSVTPPPPTEAKFNPVTLAGGNMTISWTGSGTLEQADAITGSWTAAPSQDNPQTVAVAGLAKFYRISSGGTPAGQQFSVTMSGAAEKPTAVSTAGTGSGTISISGNTLTYNITFSGLSGPATAAHIHGPADASAAAGVIKGINFPAADAGVMSGTIDLSTLTADQVTAIKAGNAYVNIHTAANGGGEIRGQLVPQ